MDPKTEDKKQEEAIKPPKLEDAGLEDCALPIHSIHQAFLLAASAVSSRSLPHDDATDEGNHKDSNTAHAVVVVVDDPKKS
ncbi:hypothetical protein vseg_007229 [Gypsophila vaccaria]